MKPNLNSRLNADVFSVQEERLIEVRGIKTSLENQKLKPFYLVVIKLFRNLLK